MSLTNSKHSYTISLPDTTPQEILRWFEFLDATKTLESELITIVSRYINEKNSINFKSSQEQQSLIRNEDAASFKSNENLYDNLFDWKSSYEDIFKK